MQEEPTAACNVEMTDTLRSPRTLARSASRGRATERCLPGAVGHRRFVALGHRLQDGNLVKELNEALGRNEPPHMVADTVLMTHITQIWDKRGIVPNPPAQGLGLGSHRLPSIFCAASHRITIGLPLPT